MKIHVCKHCGSPRVSWDAIIDPNRENEVISILDGANCEDCAGECDTQEVEVPIDFDMEKGFWKAGMYSDERLQNARIIRAESDMVALNQCFKVAGVPGRMFQAVTGNLEDGDPCVGCVAYENNDPDLSLCAGMPNCEDSSIIFKEVK